MNNKGLHKFIGLYKKEFGVLLSEKEALKKATVLLELYSEIYEDN